MTTPFKQICHWLSKPLLLHWLMPYLMVLIVVGTVAQKYIGLYDSQRIFFSSFILWVGLLPLPGGRMVSALLLVSLLAKLIIASPWSKAKSGIFIAHLGVLLLLVGGLLTAASSIEGYAVLGKNETASSFSDYHLRVLTISRNNAPIMSVPFAEITKNKMIVDAAVPFAIRVNAACSNCTMARRESATADLRGSAQKIMLSPLAKYPEDERNLAGVEIAVSGTHSDADGTYLLFEPMEKHPRFTLGSDAYDIKLGRESYPLPFSLQLLDAKKEVHPGTNTPRSYSSTVLLTDGNIRQRAVITMNHPLRYKGYTVYQSSFNSDADTAETQNVNFAVVQNSGRVFPYVASITLCVGLLIHLFLRLPSLIKRNVVPALLLCLMTQAAYADELNYDAFAQIPIQHEGRIKPLNTFALAQLTKFHGAGYVNNQPAIAWLAEVLFNPSKAMERPLFSVKDVDTQSMLKLPAKRDNLYNFTEITQAIGANHALMQSLLEKPAQELSAGQRAALELYDNAGLFTQTMLACTLFLQVSVDGAPTTFIDYYQHLPKLKDALKDVVKRKGANIRSYSTQEIQLALATQKLSMTLDSSQGNSLLRVIPPTWSHDDVWLSPWAVFHSAQGSPESAGLMAGWKELAAAYQMHDATRWQKASLSLATKTSSAGGGRPAALSLEVFYYNWLLLGKSMALYIVGFICTLLCLTGVYKYTRYIAIGTTVAAAILHFISIASRVYILERPPVGTLYESLLFVSLIAVLFGLFLEWKMRNHLGLLVATLAGSLLLFVSQSFGGDDTMSMLVAVLNTNFWLATHVLCITTGYGFGLVTGIIAHVYLILCCADRDAEKTRSVLRGGYGTALIALLFTSLGTILGGIWADQSWGRFWGWDPKENGALVICLWLIWLLHGRIIGKFKELGFAVGLALLNIVIALSWLGVNLLSTGLHSYGFTDKAAWALGGFCTAELLFAATTYFVLWRREHAR